MAIVSSGALPSPPVVPGLPPPPKTLTLTTRRRSLISWATVLISSSSSSSLLPSSAASPPLPPPAVGFFEIPVSGGVKALDLHVGAGETPVDGDQVLKRNLFGSSLTFPSVITFQFGPYLFVSFTVTDISYELFLYNITFQFI